MTALVSTPTQVDGTVYVNEPNIVDITRAYPGETFVGVLPGHDRPSFVRKRRRSRSCFTDLFRPKRGYSSEYFYHSYTGSTPPYYLNRPPSPHKIKIVTARPAVISSGGPSLPARLQKHTCGSCGKFRSNSYCRSHPLAEGEIPKPSLCRKCIDGKTSSDESDQSYEKYVKGQKRRRRRQLRALDDSYERYLRRQKRRRDSSADESYERVRATRSVRRRRSRYSESGEDSGYWSYEEPKMRRQRIVYVDRSDSQRRTRSSSGDRSVVSVSFKTEEPRRIRRDSRSRSSVEEIRIARSTIREPARPRPRYRRSSSVDIRVPSRRSSRLSENRSEGSVRFDLPPRSRDSRRYRYVDYDGESAAPCEDGVRSPLPGRSDPAEALAKRHRSPARETRSPSPVSHRRFAAQDKDTCGDEPVVRHRMRRSSRSVTRLNRPSDSDREMTYARDSEPPALAFATGARGRSLSSERRALGRDDQSPRKRRRRSKSESRGSYEHSTPTEESSANDQPERHPSHRRQPETPVRVSRLMQRLALEQAPDAEAASYPEPRRREIEYAYVKPRRASPGRSPSRLRSRSRYRSHSQEDGYAYTVPRSPPPPPRGRSPSRRRSPSRERASFRQRSGSRSRVSSYQPPSRITSANTDGEQGRSARSAEWDRLPDKDGGKDFGGRVRYVRASEALG